MGFCHKKVYFKQRLKIINMSKNKPNKLKYGWKGENIYDKIV